MCQDRLFIILGRFQSFYTLNSIILLKNLRMDVHGESACPCNSRSTNTNQRGRKTGTRRATSTVVGCSIWNYTYALRRCLAIDKRFVSQTIQPRIHSLANFRRLNYRVGIMPHFWWQVVTPQWNNLNIICLIMLTASRPIGDWYRAFPVAATRAWNSLPLSV